MLKVKFILYACIFASLHDSSQQSELPVSNKTSPIFPMKFNITWLISKNRSTFNVNNYNYFKRANGTNPSQRIDEDLDRSLKIVDQMLMNETDYVRAISKNECNLDQQSQSLNLSDSLENLMKSFFMTQRKDLFTVELGKIGKILNEKRDSPEESSLSLNVVKLKGLENAALSKYKLNLCSLKNEIEVSAPNLEIDIKYKLNGIYNDSLISGDGNLTVNIEGLELNDEWYANCPMDLSRSDSCNLTHMDTERKMKIKKATVKITGMKYRDMDEERINAAANSIIETTGNDGTMVVISELLDLGKIQWLNSLGPVPLLKQLRNVLGRVRDTKLLPVHDRSSIRLTGTLPEIPDNIFDNERLSDKFPIPTVDDPNVYNRTIKPPPIRPKMFDGIPPITQLKRSISTVVPPINQPYFLHL